MRYVARAMFRGRGVLTMLLGFALLGVQPVFVKAATNRGFGAAEIVLYRFLLACALLAVAAIVWKQSLRTQQPRVWLLRGFLGAAAVLLYFLSVEHAGAGMGTLLNYTYPIWANVFSFLIGERVRRSFWPLLLLALWGVYLVVDPRVTGVGMGEVFGLSSGFLAGGGVLCIKKLRETDGELTIISAFSSIGAIVALPFAFVMHTDASASAYVDITSWLLVLGVGITSFLGHVYFTRGYKETSIQVGTVLSLSVPVFASLCGFLFLDETLTRRFVVGGAIILASCLLLGLNERRPR